MPKWFLKILKPAIVSLLHGVLDKATEELDEEIGAQFDDEEARILKSGITMFKARIKLVIQEKF
jgi:hypothetical protein